MNDTSSFGKLLILLGVFIAIFGVILAFGWKIPWLGKLPGDVCIRRKGATFYFPFTTSVLISVVVSVIMMLLRRR